MPKSYRSIYVPSRSKRKSIDNMEAWRLGANEAYRDAMKRIALELNKDFDKKIEAKQLYNLVVIFLLEAENKLRYPYDDEIDAKEWSELFLKETLGRHFTVYNQQWGDAFYNALYLNTITSYEDSNYFLPYLQLIQNIIYAHCSNTLAIYQGQFKETEEVIEPLTIKKAIIDANQTTFADKKHEQSFSFLEQVDFILGSYLKQRASECEIDGTPKDYLHVSVGFFKCFQYSFDEKSRAVAALKKALDRHDVDLTPHLGALRNGLLGKKLRTFIQEGYANEILHSEVKTVRDFVTQLQLNNSRPQIK